MSSTNKTTNYDLSQFVGSDKPAWLADYNQDMSKIDTAVKSAYDAGTGADGKADANATAIGTLANLTTEDKTSLVGAVNEVQSETITAQNTANSASTSAATANTNIAKFNLTERSVLEPTTNKGVVNASVSNVQFATDTTDSVFKIYGRVYITGLSGQSGTLSVTLGQTSLRPSSSYTINTGAIVFRSNFTTKNFDVVPRNITIGTNGVITLTDTINWSIEEYSIMLPPCLYFNSDFGDQ